MGKKRALRLLVSSFLYCSGYNLFTELYNDLVSNVYVGTDKKIHVVKGGADSVLPFSNEFNGAKMYYLKKTTDSSSDYLGINENAAIGQYNYGADYDSSTRKTTIKYAGKYSIMINAPSGSYTAFYLNNKQIKVIGSSSEYFAYNLKKDDVVYFAGSTSAAAYIEKVSD